MICHPAEVLIFDWTRGAFYQQNIVSLHNYWSRSWQVLATILIPAVSVCLPVTCEEECEVVSLTLPLLIFKMSNSQIYISDLLLNCYVLCNFYLNDYNAKKFTYSTSNHYACEYALLSMVQGDCIIHGVVYATIVWLIQSRMRFILPSL